MHKVIKTEFAGIPLIVETGRMAKQADGAVTVQYGDTVVLATVCLARSVREGMDFFPLTVEYRDRMAAAGKIPGGFFKREGRPSSEEILRARIVDRSVRPLFPEGFRNEVQLILSTLSYDQKNSPETISVLAASLALCLSSAPFDGPVSGVKVARIDGDLVVNPSDQELAEADFELLAVGLNGRINMIECSSHEIKDEEFIEACRLAHEKIEELNELQKSFLAGLEKTKMEAAMPELDPKVHKVVVKNFTPVLDQCYKIHEKLARQDALHDAREAQLQKALKSLKVKEDSADYASTVKMIKACLDDVEYNHFRAMVLEKKIRVDGRALDEVRPIACEVDVLPRTHGSALFTRGETQALATVTLGSKRDEQIIDSLREEEARKKFLLHYNFPPYSVGEVKRIVGTSRREIGHGALAEKALENLLPEPGVFPYTIRVVSDILESNGSSSMATVCAGSLALYAAGVPMTNPCAGVAMGLVTRGDEWAVLTDIAGIEDHSGDMDFKVAGSRDGITAVQLDVKCMGLTLEQIEATVAQARKGRLHILDIMEKTLSAPRSELAEHAPRIEVIKVDPDRIREIIGPGGKMVKKIVTESGAQVDLDDDGTVHIISADANKLRRARKMINDIIRDVEVGEVYTGTVTRIMNFGAFVEVLPGKEGLVHISELDTQRVPTVEDVVQIGDEVQVKVIEIDSMGRINLSRRALLTAPAGEASLQAGGERPDRGRGRDRDRGDCPERNRDFGGRDRDRGRDRERPERDRGERPERNLDFGGRDRERPERDRGKRPERDWNREFGSRDRENHDRERNFGDRDGNRERRPRHTGGRDRDRRRG